MKARLKRLGTTASAWPGQASVNFKTNPVQPRPTRRRRMAVYTFGWILHELSRHSEAIHCQPPEEPRACHPGGDRRSRKDNVAWASSRSWWNKAYVWYGTRNKERGSQQHHHCHHQPPSPIVRQTSLPDLLAHGHQKQVAGTLAKLTSKVSVQTAPAL